MDISNSYLIGISIFQPFLVRGTLRAFKKIGGAPNWLKMKIRRHPK
jgi:hypothetical protein